MGRILRETCKHSTSKVNLETNLQKNFLQCTKNESSTEEFKAKAGRVAQSDTLKDNNAGICTVKWLQSHITGRLPVAEYLHYDLTPPHCVLKTNTITLYVVRSYPSQIGR